MPCLTTAPGGDRRFRLIDTLCNRMSAWRRWSRCLPSCGGRRCRRCSSCRALRARRLRAVDELGREDHLGRRADLGRSLHRRGHAGLGARHDLDRAQHDAVHRHHRRGHHRLRRRRGPARLRARARGAAAGRPGSLRDRAPHRDHPEPRRAMAEPPDPVGPRARPLGRGRQGGGPAALPPLGRLHRSHQGLCELLRGPLRRRARRGRACLSRAGLSRGQAAAARVDGEGRRGPGRGGAPCGGRHHGDHGGRQPGPDAGDTAPDGGARVELRARAPAPAARWPTST